MKRVTIKKEKEEAEMCSVVPILLGDAAGRNYRIFMVILSLIWVG